MIADWAQYSHLLYNIIGVVYALMVLTVIGVVLGENRNPVKSMAWVLVLLLLPVIGLIVYLVFGRSLKGTRLISGSSLRDLRRMYDFPRVEGLEDGLSDDSRQLISLVNKLSSGHLFGGNAIDVFTTGREKFEALKRDIEAAREYVLVQYFIIENDEVGSELIKLLERKAREGVKVTVLYDYVGSYHFSSRVLREMRAAGIDVHPFLEVTLANMPFRINWRNHRKLVVIDGKVGYVGGMNIANRYVTGDSKGAAWRDTHLRVKGMAVAVFQLSFAIDWNFTTREMLKIEPKRHDVDCGGYMMQMMASGPTSRWHNISLVFLRAITLAKRQVYIQTPYFLPSDALLKALQSTALSGVDVKLMIPRHPDSTMLRLATGSYIKECILSGIKVYFYEPEMMHAKVLIVDDEFVTTGSTNFDFRSFEHNFEFNALIYDKEFNRKMKDIFEADLERCTRVSLGKWKQRPVLQKALESVVRLISPIL